MSKKSFRILSAVFVAFLPVFTGCVKETLQTGIDGNKPGISDLNYEGVTHGGKTVTLTWSGAEAVKAGATSFSVQFVENTDTLGGKLIKPDMYDGTISKTVQVEANASGDKPTQFSATMEGQTVGNKYYIRVRANYPMSVYSDWTYLSTAEGKPAYFKVGRGIITEGIEDPYIYKVTGTSTGLIIKWDDLPDATAYQIEYKKTSESSWTSVTIEKGENTVLKVNGLPSSTSYDVRAKSITPAGNSEYCEIQTVSTRAPGSFPKVMSTADEFVAWLEGGVVEVNDGETFSISADIDLTGQNYTAMDESLIGIFDGGGHTVSGVSATLFYDLEATGVIKNLVIEGDITSSDEKCAALLLTNKGLVSGVTSKVNINYGAASGGLMQVAGLVAENNGTLTGNVNEGAITVTGADLTSGILVGGIAAYSSGPIDGETANRGNIKFTANTLQAAGIAGIVAYLESSVTGAVNEGEVSVTASNPTGKCQLVNTASAMPAAAGIVAYGNTDNFLIKSCTNEGKISYTLTAIEKYGSNYNRNQFGGIVANPYGLVEDCVNNGAVLVSTKTSSGNALTGSGHEHIVCVGGIGGGDYFAGSNQDKTSYKNCVNNGNVTVDTDAAQSNSAIGGICGWPGLEGARSNSTSGCTNNGNLTIKGQGKCRVGGIHGGSGTIDNCVNNGEVHIQQAAVTSVAGGIAGFSSNGFKISNCKSLGTVVSDIETQGVGGLLGNVGNSANSGKNFPGCSVACTVKNGMSTNTHTGMVIGYYNGTSAAVSVGTETNPLPVKGRIVLGGTSTKISAGNVNTYAVGTANASAGNHPVFVVFDTTPDEGGDDEPGDQPTLSAPANVKVDVYYNHTTISWDAVDGAEWYVVEYKKAGSEQWTACERTEKTSYDIEGLEHGVSYAFRVKAFAANGSGYSDEASGDTLPEVILGKPVITGATMTAKSADVAWNAVDKATAYRVEMLGPGETEWTVKAESVAETHFVVNGLKPEKTYQFRVKALGEGGNEGAEYSDPYTATTEAVSFTYPLTIDNEEDFVSWLGVADLADASAVVTIAKDLDLKGISLETASKFAGTLDGQNHTLKNLSLSAPLFGKITGSFKNLTLEGAVKWEITGDDKENGHPLAVLAAVSTAEVTGITNKASVTLTSTGSLGSPAVAGIVAFQQDGLFKGNKNLGDITVTHAGSENVSISGFNRKPFVVTGGLVGVIFNATMEDCENEGKITVTGTAPAAINARHYVGGLVGTPENARVLNSVNKGPVVADFTDPAKNGAKQVWVGGIIGGRNGDVKTIDGAYVEGCSNYGECTLIAENSVNNYLAGIAGQCTVEATGTNYTADQSTIQKIVNCHNYGKLVKKGAGGCRLGGIHGGAATLENCINEGEIVVDNITATGAVGGLVGYPTQAYHPVTGCKNTGNMTANCDVAFAMGGLLGQGGNTNQNYANNSVNCTITAPASVNAGIVLGTAKTLAGSRVINLGAADGPTKVAGTVRGVKLTADNYTQYIVGDGGVVAAETASINTEFVQFGE